MATHVVRLRRRIAARMAIETTRGGEYARDGAPRRRPVRLLGSDGTRYQESQQQTRPDPHRGSAFVE
jgi:hypothetical protein